MGVFVELEDVKLYLRVEGSEEDTLIASFIFMAQEICEGVIRRPVSELAIIPETLKQAVYYIVSQFYERREEVEIEEMIKLVRYMLFDLRVESW